MLPTKFGPPIEGRAEGRGQRRAAGACRARRRVDRQGLLRERPAEMSAGQRQVERRSGELVQRPGREPGETTRRNGVDVLIQMMELPKELPTELEGPGKHSKEPLEDFF